MTNPSGRCGHRWPHAGDHPGASSHICDVRLAPAAVDHKTHWCGVCGETAPVVVEPVASESAPTMTSPAPRWAALKVHDEQPDETDAETSIVVATRVHGPYATERAAVMVARGLNVEAHGTPDRYVPVRVEPVSGWAWDGPAPDPNNPVTIPALFTERETDRAPGAPIS